MYIWLKMVHPCPTMTQQNLNDQSDHRIDHIANGRWQPVDQLLIQWVPHLILIIVYF